MVNFRLPNGLEVVLEENHAAPVVAFQAWVKVGSADEPPRLAGVAHFAEHMFFKGTQRRGVGQIAQEVEGAGGEINAWTSYDETAYHLVLASNFFDTGLDILADSLQHSSFDAGELERERQVVLEEIKQGLDDPDRMAAQGLFQAAFDAHPYGRPIIGSPESVGAVSRDELADFVRQRYVASNITLVIVGDVDTARARSSIEQAFGDMAAGQPQAPRPTQPPRGRPLVRVVARDVKECQLLLGYRGPGVHHEDVPALDLLAVVLGQGESSRLNLEVVRNSQLVTSASAYTFAARDPGLFVVGASLPPRRPERALAAVLAEISRLRTEEISAEELAKSRTILESERVFDKETVQGYARKLGFFATIAGDVAFEERYFERLNRLGPADLREVAQRYLGPDELTVFAQIPEANADRRAEKAASLEAELQAVVARAGRSKARPSADKKLLPAGKSKQQEVRSLELDSGTRLLVLRDPSVPIVAMRATWTGGMRFETPESAGVSNMVASLLTRGTATRDAESIMQKVEGMAGSLAGYAGRNSLGLSAEFLSRHVAEGLELVADCLTAPSFPEAEIDRERRLVLEDIRAQEDNLTHVVFRAFHEEIWKHHPYRLDPLGSPESLRRLDRRRLQRFFREHYTPERLTLAVVGDVQAAEVIDRLNQLLPGSKAAGRAGEKAGRRRAASNGLATQRRVPTPIGPRRVERFLQREQAHVVVGFPGVTLDSPDRFALELCAQVLSGQGGRLFVEIREKRALAYRVSAFSVEGIDPGYFAVYVGTSLDKLDEVLTSVRRELSLLATDGVPEAELARAQRYLIGTHAIGLQRKSAIAAALAFHQAYGQGWRAYRQYSERVARVRVADLRRAAQKYLKAGREVVAIVRPQDVTPGAKNRPSSSAAANRASPRST